MITIKILILVFVLVLFFIFFAYDAHKAYERNRDKELSEFFSIAEKIKQKENNE